MGNVYVWFKEDGINLNEEESIFLSTLIEEYPKKGIKSSNSKYLSKLEEAEYIKKDGDSYKFTDWLLNELKNIPETKEIYKKVV